ncbi:uncharacterized protein LOC111326767 [Stylophora pistillata]|nr:uncharacterized protein LOC111326767 [Stylophora pistillata]
MEIFAPDPGKRVLARQADTYSPGTVTKNYIATFVVTLDNGNEIEYSYEDITAVVYDTTPNWTSLGDRVIAPSPKDNASEQYLLGFVTGDLCSGNVTETYEITLNKGHRVDNYTLNLLRKLPFFSSTHQVGARVFARRRDDFYFRGFVKRTSYHGNILYIDVQLDQSESISHQANDKRAIILDVIPPYSHVHATQRVIGYYPGYSSYLPGTVTRRNTDCWESAYRVKFDMGGQRDQDFHEIRILPPIVQFLFFP